jgi:hypothetical protein
VWTETKRREWVEIPHASYCVWKIEALKSAVGDHLVSRREKEDIRTLQSVKARMMPIASINLTFVEDVHYKIMEKLTAQGITVSRDTVSRRLDNMKDEC